MRTVDQADSARYSLEEALHPTGWVLLNFLMDSRTGWAASATSGSPTTSS